MKNFITFIFIGCLVGLGILIGRGNPGQSSPAANGQPSPATSSATEATAAGTDSPAAQGGAPTGRLYYVTLNQSNREIQRIDIATKNKQTLYSDRDQDKKISSARLTRSGDTIVMVLSKADDPAGQLVSISTEGTGKKTVLTDKFLSTTNPEISPDQSKLAFTSFSNAEPNYGFSLMISDIDGQHRKELVRDSSGIAQLAFSPDGKQIAFIKGGAAGNNQIAVVSIESSKVSSLYEFKDKLIEEFDWSPTGIVTITAASKSNTLTGSSNQSEVYLVDPKTKEAVQLTKNNQPERSPRIAPDGSAIAFIQLKTEKTADPTKPGEITLATGKGEVITTLGSALNLLGWVKE